MSSQDLDMVLAWRNHEDVRRHMYNRALIQAAEHQSWFESASQDACRHLLIFEGDGDPCGFVSLTLRAQKQVADWGFYLSPQAAAGMGRRLGYAALRHAFDELHLHKVCGEVLDYNQRSLQFHEKLGFVHEGCLRQQHFIDGQYHDVHCFGMLAPEWEQRKVEVRV